MKILTFYSLFLRTPPGDKFFVGLKKFAAPKTHFEEVHVLKEVGDRKKLQLQVSGGDGLKVERLSLVSYKALN
jgi:hypothetical protein